MSKCFDRIVEETQQQCFILYLWYIDSDMKCCNDVYSCCNFCFSYSWCDNKLNEAQNDKAFGGN